MSFRVVACLALSLGMAACSRSQPPRPQSEHRSDQPPPPKITHFYAGQPEISKGEAVLLCYGVENAAQVRLDPPAAALTPGYHRCFQVSPERDTIYRLTASGAGGSISAEVSVRVLPPAPPPPQPKPEPALIRMFVAASPEVPAGFPVTLCYSAPEAASLSLVPPVVEDLKPAERHCFRTRVDSPTTFRLTARSADGRTDAAEVTVRVR